MPTNHDLRRSLTSQVSVKISPFGIESAVSGGKFNPLQQGVDGATGYWAETQFEVKPSRLLIHIEPAGVAVTASMPPKNMNGNFAYANTARRTVAGLFVRVTPVMKLGAAKYTAHADWEWLLWYIFWPALKQGTSAQLFDKFNPAAGTLGYMGETPPYIAAGLVTLVEPDETFSFGGAGPTITYRQATDAIQTLIQVNVPPAPAPVEPAAPTTAKKGG